MNWSRAKSILLLIFVLLNLVLAYFNFWQPGQVWDSPLSGDDIYVTIRNQLLDEKIAILQSIPKKVPQASLLNLKRDDSSLLLADHLLAQKDVEKEIRISHDHEQNFIFRSDQEELIISSDEFMTYYNRSEEDDEEALISYDFAKSAAEDFIKNRLGFSSFNYKFEPFSGVENIAAQQNVIYCPTYKGAPIFDLGIDLVIQNDEVLIGNFNIYKQISSVDRVEWVTPAIDILLRLPQDDLIVQLRDQALEQDENWLVITDLRFGYFSFYQTGQEIQAQPVWRVDLDGGQVIYYDAFTAKRLFHH